MLTRLMQLFRLSRPVGRNFLMRKRHHRAVKGSGRSIPFVLICIFGGAPTEMAAQESLPVEPGVRVRVTASECELRGQVATLQALRADTLVLESTECSLASVTHLDVSRGQRSHALLGAGIGFAAGTLGTVIYCSGNRNEFSDEGKCEVLGRDFTLLATGLVGAAGGIVGVIMGYVIKTDRWEEVPLDQLRVSLAPRRDGGFAIGFSVRI